jgi:hypothetical protein
MQGYLNLNYPSISPHAFMTAVIKAQGQFHVHFTLWALSLSLYFMRYAHKFKIRFFSYKLGLDGPRFECRQGKGDFFFSKSPDRL